MSSTLIVGAAPVTDSRAFYRALLTAADRVIACDGAGEWCVALGRYPDLVVGDFDSSVAGAEDRLGALGIPIERHPSAKDESDLDLALAVARRMGSSGVTFTAAFSERLDHTLGALGTLVRARDLAPSIEEPDFMAMIVDAKARSSVQMSVAIGATVSVLALQAASGVTLEGLEFPLVNGTLSLLSSHGLSNIAQAKRVTVSVAEGTLLVIASREAVDSTRD
ncbi:MAG: thiamine diphosphokinase [Actinomycetota bacterium]|nr:MAG: thiamine [Actinomycetota bacterium]MDO8949758.1 thiamine diphosphokinase [Actinomycetota bacterium]MDP3629668.1 thiamine diphosphokinase [Actinomycetota bacterium]